MNKHNQIYRLSPKTVITLFLFTLAFAFITGKKGSKKSNGIFNPNIPLIVWRTAKTHSAQRLPNIDSWPTLNPDFEVRVHDDKESREFIHKHMPPDIIELYDTVPLGVMRADIWRYSILYVNGGIYADWDVTNLTPIQKWLPLRNHRIDFRVRERRWDFSPATLENKVGDVDYVDLQWSDCDLLVGVEGLWQFSNWTIASIPRHPALKRVLEIIIERMRPGLQLQYKWWVIYHTGPNAWTWAIISVLGLEDEAVAYCAQGKEEPHTEYAEGFGSTCIVEVLKRAWNDPIIHKRARDLRMCVMGTELWGSVCLGCSHNSAAILAQNGGSGLKSEGWIKEQFHLYRGS